MKSFASTLLFTAIILSFATAHTAQERFASVQISQASQKAKPASKVAAAPAINYDSVSAMFAAGEPVKFEQYKKGFYSARCFVSTDKNKAYNALYGSLERVVPADMMGRDVIQPARLERRVSVAINTKQPEDFFDNYSVSSAYNLVRQIDVSTLMHAMEPVVENGTLTYYYAGSSKGKMDVKFQIVSYKGMYIERMTAVRAQKMMNPWTSELYDSKANEDSMICYTTKKIGQ